MAKRSKTEPRPPRDIMVRALVTKELFDKLAAAADRRSGHAILIREAIENRK
jgi:hypothetical protein